jgi:hypothetical protein
MTFGPTHYNVLDPVRRVATRTAQRFSASWNTYTNHPAPYWLDDISVDFWGPRGRGYPIGRLKGWRLARRLIRLQGKGVPICYIRWQHRIWHPRSGWYFFNPDGIDHDDHVHVTFALYSQVADGPCPWVGN